MTLLTKSYIHLKSVDLQSFHICKKVKYICLSLPGTDSVLKRLFQLGRPGCNEEQSHEILDKYVELGGNFIDTADMYQCGRSEEIIGSWLKKYVK